MAQKAKVFDVDAVADGHNKKVKSDAAALDKPAVCHLANLPPELRDQIYECVMRNEPQIWLTGSRPRKPLFKSNLVRTNRQIRKELTSLMRVGATDIVAEVKNYDFGHIISWFNKLSGENLRALPNTTSIKANGHNFIIKLSMTRRLYDSRNESRSPP